MRSLSRYAPSAGFHLRWISDRRSRATLLDISPSPEYLLAHSLAHALITEVAIDCGNPVPAVGVLIYTASGEHLEVSVEVRRRFAQVLESALERQRLCTGDPVCADHDPATAADDRTRVAW
jgi:hypothetical protein